ncbi:MAG: hypothetical protein LBQ90_04800 [Synergistaceae bacterium]|nr:hypothetical protein [Synergistaceae bacterium]
MRERFADDEEGSRSEVSLLELLLTYAIPQKDVRPLAERLLLEYGNMSSLLEAPVEDLCRHDGIKENSAVLIKLVDWIRRHHQPRRSAKNAKNAKNAKREISDPLQGSLFDLPAEEEPRPSPQPSPRQQKASPGKRTGIFSNAAFRETIQFLPRLPDSESLDEIRAFLRSNLPFNAAQTRQRVASYITRRMFPAGYADAPLRLFARAFPDTQELRDVCFYRFLLAEPLQAEIIETLMLPNIGTGTLDRSLIRKYLSEKFPGLKSVGDCGRAVVDALAESEAAKANRTKITFAYRDVSIASFGFILHSEFPEPGMYDIGKLEENHRIKAMLWNPERLLYALYELRNLGLVSKISEIDNIRQFTTRYSLAEVVKLLASGRERT